MILQDYGLSFLSKHEFIDAMERDLNSTHSKLRDSATSDKWHTKVAKALTDILSGEHCLWLASRISRLPLLPLRDGTWVSSAAKKEVFLSQSAGIEVPDGLDLNLIHSDATKNSQRKLLFTKLEIASPSVPFIQGKIAETHQRTASEGRSKLADLVDHLRYMYRTHCHDEAFSKYSFMVLVIAGKKATTSRLSLGDVYLPDDNPFGPKKVSEQIATTTMKFLHDDYLTSIPSKPTIEAASWQDWLCDHVGIRRQLRLVQRKQPGVLSDECKAIATEHPSMFVGFLSYHWPVEGATVAKSPSLLRQLQTFKVPCHDNSMPQPISKTHLPLPALLTEAKRLLPPLNSNLHSFLELGTPIDPENYQTTWGFLIKYLGVGAEQDLDFYLEILSQWHWEGYVEKEEQSIMRVIETLSLIYGEYSKSAEKETAKENLL